MLIIYYLDNAATTKIHPDVLEAMMPYLQDNFGNAGSIYSLGRQSAEAIAKARKQIADLIGATPEHIIFTSGGSEANNLAIKGIVPYLKEINRKYIITSAIEHDSVIKAVEDVHIKHEFGASFLLPDRYGYIYPEELTRVIEAVRDNYKQIMPGLISMMCVNNEVGTVNDVKAIADICRQFGIIFHTDCVQALGFVDIKVDDIGCDMISISSHKINAPKGVGALYVRDLGLISPMVSGGAEQEYGLRGGTENVAGIVGFGKACEIIQNQKEANRTELLLRNNSLFLDELTARMNEYGVGNRMSINSPEHSKVLNIRFNGIDAQTLVVFLDSQGVMVSAGSACHSHEAEPSHVLIFMGLEPDGARDSIRVSLSPYDSPSDLIAAAGIIAKSVSTIYRIGKL